MKAGDLRERITIQLPTVVVDPIGGQAEGTPATVVSNLPAAVESLGLGTERPQAGQLRSSVSKLVRIRYREGITTSMLVLWRGLTLEIGLVDSDSQRTETRLTCAEVMT
jgi:SPP1 family predicted phage head-tail adaptor